MIVPILCILSGLVLIASVPVGNWLARMDDEARRNAGGRRKGDAARLYQFRRRR